MSYQSIILKQEFIVDSIVTVHYFEYMNDFYFPGESHDFWEFLCVDKGIVEVNTNRHQYALTKDNIIFHKPNEFHDVKANGIIAPNLVVVSFHSSSPAMEFFKDKVLTIDETERNLLASIIIETRNAFSSQLDNPYLNSLQRRQDIKVGSEQLIKLYLEQMLILLYRKHSSNLEQDFVLKSMQLKSDNEIYDSITTYLNQNIRLQLTIKQICEDNYISRSHLQKLFRKYNNHGIIEYFSQMKITFAKEMIREKNLNFTQISDFLGYSSIHYFSRQFKKISGMTPSEYSSSIKLLAEIKE